MLILYTILFLTCIVVFTLVVYRILIQKNLQKRLEGYSVFDDIGDAFKSVANAFKDLGYDIANIATDIGNKIKDGFSDFGNAFVQGISNVDYWKKFGMGTLITIKGLQSAMSNLYKGDPIGAFNDAKNVGETLDKMFVNIPSEQPYSGTLTADMMDVKCPYPAITEPQQIKTCIQIIKKLSNPVESKRVALQKLFDTSIKALSNFRNLYSKILTMCIVPGDGGKCTKKVSDLIKDKVLTIDQVLLGIADYLLKEAQKGDKVQISYAQGHANYEDTEDKYLKLAKIVGYGVPKDVLFSGKLISEYRILTKDFLFSPIEDGNYLYPTLRNEIINLATDSERVVKEEDDKRKKDYEEGINVELGPQGFSRISTVKQIDKDGKITSGEIEKRPYRDVIKDPNILKKKLEQWLYSVDSQIKNLIPTRKANQNNSRPNAPKGTEIVKPLKVTWELEPLKVFSKLTGYTKIPDIQRVNPEPISWFPVDGVYAEPFYPWEDYDNTYQIVYDQLADSDNLDKLAYNIVNSIPQIRSQIGALLKISFSTYDKWFWGDSNEIVNLSDRKGDGTFKLDMIKDGKPVAPIFGKVNGDGSVDLKTPGGMFKSSGIKSDYSYDFKFPGSQFIINVFPRLGN